MLRILSQVGMAGHKIHRQFFIPAERQKIGNPLLAARTAADGGTADPHTGQHFPDGLHGDPVQFQILRLIGMLPETGEIRLVPDLAGPGLNPVPAVTACQMLQGFTHQTAPFLRVFRRNSMRLPVEQRLGRRRKLLRHETQLQEGFQSVFQPGVHNPVQIGEAVPLLLFREGRAPFLINPHLIAEQAMAADMAEMAFLLYSGKLLLILLVKRQIQPAGPDTEVCQISEGSGISGMNHHFFAHRRSPFPDDTDCFYQYTMRRAV